MFVMALIFSPSAVKGLLARPKREARQLKQRLDAVSVAPTESHPSVVAMQGKPPGRFRVRQGDWRAVFCIVGMDVVVDRIGHRKDIYE